MDKNKDVLEALKVKNREIYINKLNIDLDRILETLQIMVKNTINLLYIEIVTQIFRINENELKSFPIKEVQSYYKGLKNKTEKVLEKNFQELSQNTKNIDDIEYEQILEKAKEQVLLEIGNYYNETINTLIELLVKEKLIDEDRLNYLFKIYLYNKFLDKISDILTSSFRIILNSQQESFQKYENLNDKTINTISPKK